MIGNGACHKLALIKKMIIFVKSGFDYVWNKKKTAISSSKALRISLQLQCGSRKINIFYSNFFIPNFSFQIFLFQIFYFTFFILNFSISSMKWMNVLLNMCTFKLLYEANLGFLSINSGLCFQKLIQYWPLHLQLTQHLNSDFSLVIIQLQLRDCGQNYRFIAKRNIMSDFILNTFVLC